MNYLLLLNFITPCVLMLVGCLLKIYPAHGINSHRGYNTTASRKSLERWEYAQSIAPGEVIKIGYESFILMIIIISILIISDVKLWIGFTIGGVLQLAILIYMFAKIDKKINDKFVD